MRRGVIVEIHLLIDHKRREDQEADWLLPMALTTLKDTTNSKSSGRGVG